MSATAGNKRKIFGQVWSCCFQVMQADRQTNRHTDILLCTSPGGEVIRSSTDAEIERHVSRWMPPNCNTPHFPFPRSQDTTIRVGIGMHVANTPTYPFICPLFVAVCDHNQLTLHTDRLYRRTSCHSINAACYILYGPNSTGAVVL